MKKSFLQKSNLAMATLFIVGIAAAINFLSYQIFYSFDLTQNKDYSISPVTKKTLANLDDVINIKVYFSKQLPNEFLSLSQNVKDILDGYTNYSKGKVRVEFIDPADDEKVAQNLQTIGIPELQFQVFNKDQMQLVKGYLGMDIQYGDKNQVLPVVKDTKSLEYQITLAIKKVTSTEKNVLGIVTSNGTKTSAEIDSARKNLAELYDIWDVDLTKKDDIYKEVKTLLIIGPTGTFTEDQLKKIDAFVMRGGSLLVLRDGVKIDNGLQTTENNTGLEKLLSSYGIKLNNDLVLETKDLAAVASFNQGFFTFSTNYPYWPRIIKDGFDQKNSAVSKLENLTLPWVSSIDIDQSKLGEGASIDKLAQTSANSWKQSGSFNLNPQQNFAPSGQIGKNLVAALVEAKFKSPYNKTSEAPAKIIVVGDSDFIGERMAQGDNMLFFQNLVDSLSLDSDLIEIRSKGITDRPIKADLEDSTKNIIRYANVFGMTIVVLAFGLSRYYLRRRSKFADEL